MLLIILHKGASAYHYVSNNTSFVAVAVIVAEISPGQKLDGKEKKTKNTNFMHP